MENVYIYPHIQPGVGDTKVLIAAFSNRDEIIPRHACGHFAAVDAVDPAVIARRIHQLGHAATPNNKSGYIRAWIAAMANTHPISHHRLAKSFTSNPPHIPHHQWSRILSSDAALASAASITQQSPQATLSTPT
jgi:hypothetical protein